MGLTKFSKIGFYYFLCCVVFLALSIFYFFNITMVYFDQYSIDFPYSEYANYHDHFVYKSEVMKILDGQFQISDFSLNVTGVAIIYYLANLAFPVSFEASSFLLNVIVLAYFFWIYYSLCRLLNLNGIYFFLIFSVVYFIYLGQLANKDVFYVCFLLLFLKFLIVRSYLKMVLVSIFCAFFVRTQAILLLLFVILYFFSWLPYAFRLFFVYIAASILGVFASKFLIGEGADLGGGVAKWLIFLNQYYIGNILLNPIRLIQYMYDFFRFPFYYSRFVDLLLIPLVIVFFITFSQIRYMFKKNFLFSPFSFFFFCLIMTMLIVPIVNLRYFVLIFPVYFLLLGLGFKGKRFA